MSQQSLLPWVHKGGKIAIVGDLILDEYLIGNVHRISPEAPVPVHLVSSTMVTAGGAANVARNVKLAGGHSVLLGALGADESGTQLKSLMEADGIDCGFVSKSSQRITIKKTRVTAGSQQIVRIDWERVQALSDDELGAIGKNLEHVSCQVLIVSDYGKGLVNKPLLKSILEQSKKSRFKVAVDPKGGDFERYRGAYLITPNRKEACEALGVDLLEKVDPLFLGKEIAERFGIDHVLVTLGAEGMYWYGRLEKESYQLPARARRVFDVSGAGDTVVAVMALGISAGLSVKQCMEYANAAAGRVVEKWGTQPILASELIEELNHSRVDHEDKFAGTSQKIVDLNVLLARYGLKNQRKDRLVFTNGCFDILHLGHISYLEECRKRGDRLVVALNSDRSVRALKGAARPYIGQEDRAAVLAALSCVDAVVIFDEDTPESLIGKVLPDVLIKGADYTIGQIAGGEIVLATGGVVETVPLVAGRSTTSIIEKIKLS